MARVTKEAEVRRDELLDVALALCVTVGFEGTSVERITSEAGVAKGTFYHYFASKQDLLAQLVDRFGDQLFTHLETEMAGVEGDAVQRLQALMRIAGGWKLDQLESAAAYLPFLYKEENYTLRHKLWSAWLERTRPLLLEIIDAGAREGTLDIEDPDATTGIVLSLWFDASNRTWERALAAPDEDAYADVLLRGLTALWDSQERILGAPRGSLAAPPVDRATLVATRSMMPRVGETKATPEPRRGPRAGVAGSREHRTREQRTEDGDR